MRTDDGFMTYVIRAARAISAAMVVPCASAMAQATSSTILHAPGQTIEILGLSRWTADMLQDSLRKYVPGQTLESHSCAANLRYKLHFAEAAADVIRMSDSSRYIIVSVIEPQDSALVRHRVLPRDTTDSHSPWPLLVALARDNPRALEGLVRERIVGRGSAMPPAMPEGVHLDTARVRRAWAFLDAHRTSADAKAARRTLARAPNVYDRMAAIAILSSFDQSDTTWWSLVATLREEEGSPRGFAAEVLQTFVSVVPHRVDWRPAANDLHALLNGANLWDIRQVLTMLVYTGVTPQLAPALLRHGGHAVLMEAGAAQYAYRVAAHEFLRAISGRDYGDDFSAWAQWIAHL